MGWVRNEDVFKACVGRTVVKTRGETLYLDDGNKLHLELYGECCSQSFFTDLKQFEELEGAKILNIEEREGQSDNNLPEPEGDVISWHFLVFTTDKGHVTIDWHNESNGYYDGSLTASVGA